MKIKASWKPFFLFLFLEILHEKVLTNTVHGYSMLIKYGKKEILFMESNQEHNGNQGTEILYEEHSHKKKERTPKELRDLVNRLSRIEGQVRGIKGMVERDAYCIDILVQVAAVNAALNSFSRVLLSDHIKTCVTQDILDGKEETVDELVETIRKLMK